MGIQGFFNLPYNCYNLRKLDFVECLRAVRSKPDSCFWGCCINCRPEDVLYGRILVPTREVRVRSQVSLYRICLVKVALVDACTPNTSVSPVSIPPPVLAIYSFTCHQWKHQYNNWQLRDITWLEFLQPHIVRFHQLGYGQYLPNPLQFIIHITNSEAQMTPLIWDR